MALTVVAIKYCPKCNKIFPATDEFFRVVKVRDKFMLRSECKFCEKEYHLINYKGRKKYLKEYYKENKKQIKITNDLWLENNKDKRANNEGKRRSMKLNQTPILTQQEKRQIEILYKKSQELGSNWHVDHITPLSKGGLHHPDNLQIVVKKYNLEKGSKLNFRLPLNTEVYRWQA